MPILRPDCRLLLALVAAWGLTCCSKSTTAPTTAPSQGASRSSADGYVTIVNTSDRKFEVQSGAHLFWTIQVTSATHFEGVPDFDGLVAANRAGYQLHTVTIFIPTNVLEGPATAVTIDKIGPNPVHFHYDSVFSNTVVGVPVLVRPPSTIVIVPWTTVRADSEFASLGDIQAAVAARALVCVAGDGFAVASTTQQATTIGAWRYSSGDSDPCRGK